MSRPVVTLVLLVILMAISLTARAHSWSELNDWLTDWDSRFEASWTAIRVGQLPPYDPDALTAEYENMRARHPAWSGEILSAPDPVDPHTVAPSVALVPVASPVGTNPAPAPEPPPPPVTSGVEQWRSLVASYFPASEVNRALCIMGHESGGDPSAKNPRSTAAGLFQFLRSTWDQIVPADITGGSYDSGQVYDPTANVRSAAWLVGADGWHHWSPWNRGLCR